MNAFDRYAPFIQEYIFRSGWKSLRPVQVAAADVIFHSEDNVLISIELKGDNEADIPKRNEMICYRYIQPLKYGKEECISRYGEDTGISSREHQLVAIFPASTEELKTFTGTLYSFLPTQVKLTVPIILHVPYT